MNSTNIVSTSSGRRSHWLFVLAFLSCFATYTTDEDKFILYFLAVLLLFLAALVGRFDFRGKPALPAALIFYFLVASLSVLFNVSNLEGVPLQAMVYPVSLFLIAGSLWKFIGSLRGAPAIFVFGLFFLNGVVALFSSVLSLDRLPILGDIAVGRTIFFTPFQSSGGLVWNVNYYAAVQGAGFWWLYSLVKRGAVPSWLVWAAYFVGFSVILGSSRSCTFAMISSVLAYRLCRGSWGERIALLFGVSALLMSLSALYLWAIADPDLNQNLRIYKGLNNRDERWAAALHLILQAPWLGYGSAGEVAQRMLLAGAGGTAVQNSLIATQLLFGVGGTLVFLYVIVGGVWQFAITKNKSSYDSAIFSLIVFCVIDSFVRSYLMGGVGPIPLMLVASSIYLSTPSRLRAQRREFEFERQAR